MLRSEFLEAVAKLGRRRNVTCRVSERGVILFKFSGDAKERQILRAVCLATLKIPVSDWVAAYPKLQLSLHTAGNVTLASKFPLKRCRTRGIQNTRKELFRLLQLSKERL
ncbi:MAG: hypothetical protein CMI53_02265 [Parcubacteria group bacterium]|nr:hypothetical protein [Parcubacteria group bacterium]|tara:strand:- start:18166 stop:18495 length:330 start_codon:yes stop_codon:yes gene_type:complete